MTEAQKCPLCGHGKPLVLHCVVICPDCNLSVPHHGQDAPVYMTALEKWNGIGRRLKSERDEAIKNKEVHWKLNDSAMKRERESMNRSEVYRQALESICKLEGDGSVTARIFAKAALLKVAEI